MLGVRIEIVDKCHNRHRLMSLILFMIVFVDRVADRDMGNAGIP